MRKKDYHIEIVRTDMPLFRSMSMASAKRIQTLLAKHYQQVAITTIDSLADIELLTRKKPDLLFLGLKRLPVLWGNDNIWMSDYLDRKEIAYTGSAQPAIALDFDKEEAKAQVRRAGLRTPSSFTAAPEQFGTVLDLPLPLPLFVKPLSGGGGYGIGDDSVVRTFQEFQQKVGDIADRYDSASLVETYLTGREFSVSILESPTGGEPLVMPIEIITEKNVRGDRILGSRVKHEDHEQVKPVADRQIHEAVCSLAKAAYAALGARDFGRIDMRMDDSGNVHFIEANFMPAPGSRYFAGSFDINAGISYDKVLVNIVELGLARVRARDITRASV